VAELGDVILSVLIKVNGLTAVGSSALLGRGVMTCLRNLCHSKNLDLLNRHPSIPAPLLLGASRRQGLAREPRAPQP
jgi:hypothetical protein